MFLADVAFEDRHGICGLGRCYGVIHQDGSSGESGADYSAGGAGASGGVVVGMVISCGTEVGARGTGNEGFAGSGWGAGGGSISVGMVAVRASMRWVIFWLNPLLGKSAWALS